MEVKTKFQLGDKVWFVDRSYKKIKCPFCKGRGRISLKGEKGEEETFSCPKCHAKKYTTHDCATPAQGTVFSIFLDIGVVETCVSYTVKSPEGSYFSALKDTEVFFTQKECEAYLATRGEEGKEED